MKAKKIYEYGAMSSKYSLEAENKLTAYATMVLHFGRNAEMVAIYTPEEAKKDSWLFAYPLEKRLDEIFGGDGAFMKYLDEHDDEIKECYESVKKVI